MEVQDDGSTHYSLTSWGITDLTESRDRTLYLQYKTHIWSIFPYFLSHNLLICLGPSVERSHLKNGGGEPFTFGKLCPRLMIPSASYYLNGSKPTQNVQHICTMM